MPRDVIAVCPVCENELSITRLHCRSCGTSIEGDFSVGRFGRLSKEQMTILESFLRSRGNLKEMERELGISYPTVRGRVEMLVRALGLAEGDAAADTTAVATAVEDDQPTQPQPVDRRAILERLARHEISAEDAAEALRGMSGGA
ncbi:MAG TPA: DUF2089 domain-containing protein [Candidatus Limnocylindria bacterium]|nr:DUF2089 domain-containing protein [Candidatus Limnocylindria bacterium]